jgi:hypothetical protein
MNKRIRRRMRRRRLEAEKSPIKCTWKDTWFRNERKRR